MGLAIKPFRLEQDFLMMPITSGERGSINVCQRLRMAEITGITKRKIQRDRLRLVPISRDNKCGTQDKILFPCAPILIGRNFLPGRIIYIGFDGRMCCWACQLLISKRGQVIEPEVDKRSFAVIQGSNKFESLFDFFRCPASLMIHEAPEG